MPAINAMDGERQSRARCPGLAAHMPERLSTQPQSTRAGTAPGLGAWHLPVAHSTAPLPAADVLTIENSRSGDEMIRALAAFKYSRDIGAGVYDVHSPVIPPVDFMKQKIRHVMAGCASRQPCALPGPCQLPPCSAAGHLWTLAFWAVLLLLQGSGVSRQQAPMPWLTRAAPLCCAVACLPLRSEP